MRDTTDISMKRVKGNEAEDTHGLVTVSLGWGLSPGGSSRARKGPDRCRHLQPPSEEGAQQS